MTKFISALIAGFIVTGFAAPSFGADTPEDNYIATRDAAIAELKAADKAGTVDDATRKKEEDVRAALEQQVRAILGPVAIKGMSGAGKLNVETLFDGDIGAGTLDGLRFASDDDKTQVIVTTDGLARRWLIGHSTWWGEQNLNVPKDLAAAVASEPFYTQAMSSDAAVSKYAQIPLAKPVGATLVYALLAARSQDQAPPKADEVFVVVAHGGKVYVASTNASAPIGPMPACEALRRGAVEKPQEEQEKAEAAFLRCFAERAPKDKRFASAIKDAQALVSRLPLR